jgi:hypothetical protein
VNPKDNRGNKAQRAVYYMSNLKIFIYQLHYILFHLLNSHYKPWRSWLPGALGEHDLGRIAMTRLASLLLYRLCDPCHARQERQVAKSARNIGKCNRGVMLLNPKKLIPFLLMIIH